MKSLTIILFSALTLFAFASEVHADDPPFAMKVLFEKYPNFPCVGALELAPQLPVLNRFADQNGLGRSAVNCFFYVWIYNRDLENNRTLTIYDYAALHYRDVNAAINALGGMDAYRINDSTDRPKHGTWIRWLNRYELGD